MKLNKHGYFYLVWMAIFIAIPLLMVVYFAFTTGDSQSISSFSFSVENFKRFFTPMYLEVLNKSIQLALISTFICLLLGYPVAYIISKEKIQYRNVLILLFVIPMWMNFLLRTYAWLSLLETNNGFINVILRTVGLPTLNIIGTPNAIILGMVYNFLPFMVLPIYNALTRIDPYVLEAAYDLGANEVKRLIKVVLPLSLPGIMSGITMVFMPAVTSFVIPNLLGSGKVNLIGNLIEQQFLMTFDWGFGAALSFVLMVIILISMGILRRFDGDMEGGTGVW